MKKILVIDDEESLRQMVGLALRQRGYAVVEAENGTVGIEKARANLPDLILCDVNMEKMDGYHTLSILRNNPATAAVPFILMTGLADPAGMRQGMELGADDYLPKPFTVAALYAAVEARLKKAEALRAEAERRLTELRDAISLALPHELRTPLNGILAFGEILKAESGSLPPAEIADMGQMICESGRRLERLVENFLIHAQLELFSSDPAKLHALRVKQTLRPARIIAEQARRQAELAERPADLELRVPDLPVPMSEEYLGKVVAELVQNAFKFSATGRPVRVALAATPEALTLAVEDQGRGFTTEQITKVGAYMQFDRKLHEQQGLGLGLNIARRLAELHGGTLGIHSQAGGGTAIEIRFPKAPASSEPRSPLSGNPVQTAAA